MISERNKVFRRLFLGGILVCTFPAFAQDNAALAKAAQNPIASMISVPFQNNTNFNFGPYERTQNVLNIQPVLPFKLNDKCNLITRTIIPVISQPATAPGQDRRNGLGDMQFTAFFSPSAAPANGWIWGVGAIAQLDTATSDRLGAGAWGLLQSCLKVLDHGLSAG